MGCGVRPRIEVRGIHLEPLPCDGPTGLNPATLPQPHVAPVVCGAGGAAGFGGADGGWSDSKVRYTKM